MELEDTTKVYSVGYDLEDVKVEFSHDLKINVSGIQIDGKEGEIMNIPRWIAKTLHSDNHIVIHEQDMSGVLATVAYAVKALLDPELPPNRGLLEYIEIKVPEGTILNPRCPAAVGARTTT